MIDNLTKVPVGYCYHTWSYGDRKVSLIREDAVLAWSIDDGKSTPIIISFVKSIVPAATCDRHVIALIKQIRENAFNNSTEIKFLINNFKISGIFDNATYIKELTSDLGVQQTLNESDNKNYTAARLKSNLFSCGAILGSFGMVAVGVISMNFNTSLTGCALMLLFNRIIDPCAINPWLQKKCKIFKTSSEVTRKAQLTLTEIKRNSVPFFIEVEPLSVPSKLDENVVVSKFNWAVTCQVKMNKCGQTCDQAIFFIEGLNNGAIDYQTSGAAEQKNIKENESFIFTVHFPSLEGGLCQSPDPAPEFKKLSLWLITAEKATNLLKDFICEIDNKNSYWTKCDSWLKSKFDIAGIDPEIT